MTVTTQTNRIDHVGTGSATLFPYNYLVYEDSHLEVYLDGVLTTTGFTIINDIPNSNGDVDFDVAPASGVAISIIRVVPLTQLLDYTAFGPFPAETHEKGLDLGVMRDQQNAESDNQELRVPITDPTPGEVPEVLIRATKLLGFDANGDPVVSDSTVDDVDDLVAAGLGSGQLMSSFSFIGDGVETDFVLGGITVNHAASIMAFIDGISQNPDVDYTVVVAGGSTTVTFTTAPPNLSDVRLHIVGHSKPVGAADASNITYIPHDGAPGVQGKAIDDRLDERISIKDFGAKGDGVADDTAAIQAAIDFTRNREPSQTEMIIDYPAGTYKITTLNYVGARRVTNRALGAVIFSGTAVGGFAMLDIDGGTTTHTNRLDFIGNFSCQTGQGGGTYQYAVYISFVTNSRIQMSASGPYSVNTIYIDFSWDNPELAFFASNNSETAIATVKAGNNNVNVNNFVMRTTGATDLGVASIGFELGSGNANTVRGDFSSSRIGLLLNASKGTTVLPSYFELTVANIRIDSIAKGTVILGGLFEVLQDGAAFDIINAQHTTIIGPYIKGVGTATNRTAFILGNAVYGLTVQQPDIETATIDAAYSGLWRGEGNFTNSFNTLAAQWIGFPPTAVLVDEPNTLDDYIEGTFTPTLVAEGTDFTSVTYAAGTSGLFTKIGNVVHFQLFLRTDAITVGPAAGNLYIPLPYVSHDDGSGGFASGNVSLVQSWAQNTPIAAYISLNSNKLFLQRQLVFGGDYSTSKFDDPAIGAGSNQIVVSGTYIVHPTNP